MAELKDYSGPYVPNLKYEDFSKEVLVKLLKAYSRECNVLPAYWAEEVRKRLCSLAAYVKDIKQGFTRYYNKKYNRKGYFWGDRFKSMIVQQRREWGHYAASCVMLRDWSM